ncbi:MAG TPA: methionine--tRNA ligase [Verrucomicrobiota bacterium]|nr:methionine--tRNA ligase [Verrucomicrobiales bacterium]HRI12136.1 methionine--tRNA ligase [Verrucomicrobiota bacterium]
MSKQFYVTTAIYYVNGAPHLGHAYEMVVADVIARARRAMGEEVFFLTGLDEHGQKVEQAAQAEGKLPQIYCDELAIQWEDFARRLGLSYDDFVRTTQARHHKVVTAFLSRLHEGGHFYKAGYEGWYSVKEETFLTDKDQRPDGTWDPQWGEVVRLKEENWYFKMGQHQQWLIEFLESHPDFVQPAARRNEVLGFLRTGPLEDLCISRPRARLTWGIPLPFDADYVNYVWFDALVNYVSVPASLGDPAVAGSLGLSLGTGSSFEAWPADLHIIGKDIVKFHAVYWPIMLHVLGAPLPKTILAHGWWQKDGAKLSKSTGNVVDPLEVITEWGLDAFRYYVVRELAIGPDGNWTDEGFRARYNAELANGLGNLLNRALSMLNKYRGGVVPVRSDELAGDTEAAVANATEQLRANELQAALVSIWTLVTRANLYVEQTAPFKLARDPAQAARLDAVLYNLVEVCRVLGVLLAPFIPDTAAKIFAQLNLSADEFCWAKAKWGGLVAGHQVGAPQPLFPRKDLGAK